MNKRATTTTIKSNPYETECAVFVDERGQSTKSYVKDCYVDTLRSVYSLSFGALYFAVSVCMCARVMPNHTYRLYRVCM